jgi:hypothetical protein
MQRFVQQWQENTPPSSRLPASWHSSFAPFHHFLVTGVIRREAISIVAIKQSALPPRSAASRFARSGLLRPAGGGCAPHLTRLLIFLSSPARALFLPYCYHRPRWQPRTSFLDAPLPHLTPQTKHTLNCEPSSRNFKLSPISEFFAIVKGTNCEPGS